MDTRESFIDSIDDEVLIPQPFLTPVTGNDCCKWVLVIGTKEREAALLLLFFTYRLIKFVSAQQSWVHTPPPPVIKHKHNYLHNFWILLPSVCLLKKVLSRLRTAPCLKKGKALCVGVPVLLWVPVRK